MSKEVDRILNERVKLKTSVVGVGFAGSYNAQAIHEKLSIPAFIINSSIKDLSENIIKKDIPSFVIGDEGRGAGSDRQKSKELFKVNRKELVTEVESFVRMITNSDIIFIIFSSAGGTGSGTGPDLVRYCRRMYSTKTFIPIIIAPRKYDSALSQYNNLECINEIDALGGPYVIGDLDVFSSDKENVAYEKMSEWIIEVVQKLSGMDMELSDAGMMDENETLILISAPGYLVEYTIEVCSKSLENDDIQGLLNKRILSSPAMLIQRDKHVAWGGLIVNLPEDLDDPITTGDVSKITSIIGEPKHLYKNFSVSKSTKGSVTLILSGMSLPHNRLSESKERVKEYLDAEAKSQRNISLAQDLAELNGDKVQSGFGGFSMKKVNSKPVDDIDSLFD